MEDKDYKLLLSFDNGWEASIINNKLSYGLELATLQDDKFKEFKGVTGKDGVVGYLTDDELAKHLYKISKWKK